MKILFFFNDFPMPYQPYVDDQLCNLGKSKSISITVHCHVFHKELFKKKYENTGIKVKELKKDAFCLRNLRAIYALLKGWLYTKYRGLTYYEQGILIFDIIHLQQSYLSGVVLKLLNKQYKSKPKIFITFRGGETYIKPWADDKWRNRLELIKNNMSGIQVFSGNQAAYLVSKWNFTENKIHIIPIGINLSSDSFKVIYNKNKIVIASIYRLCWEKNIEGNLRVVNYIKEQGFNVEYHVFGDGQLYGHLKYLINQFQLEENVTLHGKLERSQMFGKLVRCNYLLQLSISESLGASVIEAQSIGLPAIVSNVGGMPETISINKSGFVIDYYDYKKAGDTLIEINMSEQTYNNISECSIENVRTQFNIEKEHDKLIHMYEN